MSTIAEADALAMAAAPERATEADAATGTPRVRHVPPGEGQAVWVAGDTYTFKAVSRDTDGRLFAWEAEIPPGAGPPPHIHLDQFEAYYLIEGELEVLDRDRTFTARAGSFVYIPEGAVHAFRNRGDRPARMLLWMTPGGFEEFFMVVGQLAIPGRTAPPLGPEEVERSTRAAARYGLKMAEAPGWAL